MPKTIEGKLIVSNKKFAIVVSRFNDAISQKLLDGAVNNLLRHGIDDKDITVTWVPGAFEIPLLAKTLAVKQQYSAIIALGCIIRGDTAHFDYVAGETANGIGQVSLETNTPIIFGVLTTDTIEQATERAGSKAGNKGADAALAALEMASLMEQLSG